MSRSQRRSERGAQSWRRSSSSTAPWIRVHANCSSVAPFSGSYRSMEAISASRPQEMKSSTSQRAGSSRTFLKTMYFTSGAKVMTRRLRTRTSPVVLYSRQRACASSGEMRFFVCWREDMLLVSVRRGPHNIPHWWYSLRRRSADGAVERIRPRQHLGDGEPELLGHLLAQVQAGQRGHERRVLADGNAGLGRARKDPLGQHA